MNDPGFTPTQLAARAAYLLRGNDLGTMTSAAPRLYPHMWSWDAAFVSVGLAPLSVERAVVELDTLLSAQWRNGMIPHIVFANGVDGYFPGPARWECRDTRSARAGGTRHLRHHPAARPRDRPAANPRSLAPARPQYPRGCREVPRSPLARFRPLASLARARPRPQTGRSNYPLPRLGVRNGQLAAVGSRLRQRRSGGRLPPYLREDKHIVTDAAQRPSDLEYDRYLWLVEEMRRAHYDDAELAATMSFAVEDVFVSAVFAVACEVLAIIGEDHRKPNADVRDLHSWAERFRQGVVATTDERSGAARDFDVRTGRWIPTETLAMFAPLLSGGLPRTTERALLRIFEGPRFCGHPDLKYALPPSTSPVSAAFRPKEYWRGPVWPVMSWLFSWAFARRGWSERSLMLRAESLRQASDGSFAEYYEPFTGEPLGSMQQSWTAAAVLDWLG